jgi:hypothetical protein
MTSQNTKVMFHDIKPEDLHIEKINGEWFVNGIPLWKGHPEAKDWTEQEIRDYHKMMTSTVFTNIFNRLSNGGNQ